MPFFHTLITLVCKLQRTIQPDATLLVCKLQSTYFVFFLTNGGMGTYADIRRNSLEEAIKLCLEAELNGIVAEVRSILKNPGLVKRIKDAKLSLISYAAGKRKGRHSVQQEANPYHCPTHAQFMQQAREREGRHFEY